MTVTTIEPHEEMVKLMERGQITLPSSIRKKLNLSPKTWFVIKIVNDNEIVLEPYKKSKREKLNKFLAKMANDKRIYWTTEDEKRRQQIRRLSTKRVRELAQW